MIILLLKIIFWLIGGFAILINFAALVCFFIGRWISMLKLLLLFGICLLVMSSIDGFAFIFLGEHLVPESFEQEANS